MATQLQCPFCKCSYSRVRNVQTIDFLDPATGKPAQVVVRHRVCQHPPCQMTWTTHERIKPDDAPNMTHITPDHPALQETSPKELPPEPRNPFV
jgi:hypothetical protein